MQSRAQVVQRLDDEIRRLNSRLAELRQVRRRQADILCEQMEKLGVKEMDGVKLSRVKRRAPRRTRKLPKKQRREVSIELLRNVGVPDADAFWERLEAAQTVKPDGEPSRQG